MQPLIVTHGGAGSPIKYRDGTEKAAKKGYSVLRKKGNAVDAVIEAVVVLENDPRFNAGTGSKMRLDGSIEMDAAVMTSDLSCGSVAAIKNVKNPVKVAGKVMQTPHVLLAGEEATNFARKNNFRFYNPATKEALRKLENAKNKLKNGKIPEWAKKWKNLNTKNLLNREVWNLLVLLELLLEIKMVLLQQYQQVEHHSCSQEGLVIQH